MADIGLCQVLVINYQSNSGFMKLFGRRSLNLYVLKNIFYAVKFGKLYIQEFAHLK